MSEKRDVTALPLRYDETRCACGWPDIQCAVKAPASARPCEPDRLEQRGGNGPLQPIWDDVMLYSAEWYRRYRDWHHAEYPDSDQVTRRNLDLLVDFSQLREDVTA